MSQPFIHPTHIGEAPPTCKIGPFQVTNAKKWPSVYGTDNLAWRADDGRANKAKSRAILRAQAPGRAVPQGDDWAVTGSCLGGPLWGGAREPKPE